MHCHSLCAVCQRTSRLSCQAACHTILGRSLWCHYGNPQLDRFGLKSLFMTTKLFFGGAIWFDRCTCKKIKSKITWFKRQSWNKWMDAVLLHLLLTQLLIATYDVISNIHWRWQQDCHRSWTYFICGCWKCMENRYKTICTIFGTN